MKTTTTTTKLKRCWTCALCTMHRPHCKREHQSIRCSFELHFQLLDIWLNSIRFSKHFIRILTSHFRSFFPSLLLVRYHHNNRKKLPLKEQKKKKNNHRFYRLDKVVYSVFGLYEQHVFELKLSLIKLEALLEAKQFFAVVVDSWIGGMVSM